MIGQTITDKQRLQLYIYRYKINYINVSRGIGGRDGSGRPRREVQESMRRNHKLNVKVIN